MKAPRTRSAIALVVLATAAVAPHTARADGQLTLDRLGVVYCDGGRCLGTEASDTIVASNQAERVFGRGGNDSIELDAIFLVGNSDVAYGGPGRDCIDGGGGDDVMLGGTGDDNVPCAFSFFVDPAAAMTGGPGADTIDGGPGNDSMNGIFDDDLLLGGTGNDLLQDFFSLDSDRMYGGPGSDTVNGSDGDGDDVVDGGTGVDTCYGDPGDRFANCERRPR